MYSICYIYILHIGHTQAVLVSIKFKLNHIEARMTFLQLNI